MAGLPIRVFLAAACVLAPAASPTAAADPPAGASGTYRVRTSATARAPPVLEERFEREVEVTLAPERSGAIRIRLESEQYRCELAGRISPGGEITFVPQQRCTLSVSEPAARGRVEARLESGNGRLRGEKLEIDVSWALSGATSLLVGGRTVEVLGRQMELPGTWMPEVPLRGTVRATGSGTRIREPGRR